jgi:ABC-type bacteriocin/lantibiotic exporter with double-glycine peptidase domain
MRLEVLHIKQERSNSCWHAAARMLFGYKRYACTHPLPKLWDKDEGLQADEFIRLARSLGLVTMSRVRQSYDWTFLRDRLKSYGPLWVAGQWNGPNHIVVITGVDVSGKVYVNDPAFPSPVVRNIGWFNDKIDKIVDSPIMYLP